MTFTNDQNDPTLTKMLFELIFLVVLHFYGGLYSCNDSKYLSAGLESAGPLLSHQSIIELPSVPLPACLSCSQGLCEGLIFKHVRC